MDLDWIWHWIFFHRDGSQTSLLLLSELINVYTPRNHQKTIGFLVILGGIGLNFINSRNEIYQYLSCSYFLVGKYMTKFSDGDNVIVVSLLLILNRYFPIRLSNLKTWFFRLDVLSGYLQLFYRSFKNKNRSKDFKNRLWVKYPLR